MQKKFFLIIFMALSFVLSACENTEALEIPVQIDADELLQSIDARKAIALTIDKKFIANDIYSDGSYAADYIVPRDFITGPTDTIYESVDFRSGANLYLRNDLDYAESLWMDVREEFEFDEVQVDFKITSSDLTKLTADAIKEQLEEHLPGLIINIKKGDDYDMKWNGWAPDYMDPLTFLEIFTSDSAFNESFYASSEYDLLIDKVNNATNMNNPDLRWELLHTIESVVLEDVGVIPVIQRNEIVLYSDDVSNWVEHSVGPLYSFRYMESLDNEVVLMETQSFDSFDSTFTTNQFTTSVIGNVVEGLFSLGENDQVVNGLVKSYIRSEDGLTYTFSLKEKVKWVDSNGDFFDYVEAEDFIYAWNRLMDEELNSSYSYLLEDTAKIESFRAIDASTIEIKLNTEVPYLTSILALPTFAPINEKYVKLKSDRYGTSIDTILYNGAFMIDTISSDEVILKKNLSYYEQELVKLDRVRYLLNEEVSNDELVDAYLNQEIDRVSLAGSNVSTYKQREDAEVVSKPVIYYITFK